LLLENALLVYELTDFSIHFIDAFKLEGIREIEEVHREMQKTIASLRDEQKALKKQTGDSGIEAALRERVVKDVEHREESIGILEGEWKSYMGTIKDLQGEIGLVSRKLPSLRLIRANAKAQINMLAAVAVLQTVQSSIKAIEGTVLQLEQLELASLSADRVKRLLGI
jgi:hypothetical protein